MNYRQWLSQLNPSFQDAYYDSPLDISVARMDDLFTYLMM